MAAVLKPFVETLSRFSGGHLRGFESGAREIDDAELRVEGRLPEWLSGALLLNGPALWELPHGRYEHWFDGLAMLHRIAIHGGRARYRSRYIASEDHLQSVAQGKPAFGAFDTRSPTGWFRRLMQLRNPRISDNPSVVLSRIGERWVASTETPLLTGFDADTLATTGRVHFDDDAQIHLMAAHGRTDERGDYWNVGIKLGPRCTYKLLRVRAGAARREVMGTLTVRKAGYTHAFAMTPGHALIWETALRAQPLSFMFTGRAYIRNFRWDAGSGSRLHAMSLADGTVRSWDIPSMVCFHAIQAYAEGDDLVAELCVFDDARVFDELRLDRLREGGALSAPRLVRYRLKRGQGYAEPEVFGADFELPQIHPLRYGKSRASVAWGSGTDGARPALFDRTVRLDLETGKRCEWQRSHAVQLEPLFVPRPGGRADDDGALLVPTLADRDPASLIAVLDARTMECIASLLAPQVIPFGFHAAWHEGG